MDIGPNETVVHVDANHRSICKFADSNDPMYKEVFRRIRELVRDAPNIIRARFDTSTGE
jgi:hypothetical protein